VRVTHFWLVPALFTLVVALFLGISGCGGGGGAVTTYTVSGRVSCEASAGDPTTITVGIEGTDLTARPDAEGYFSLQGVPAGTVWVYAISADGAAAGRVEVQVNGDQPTVDIGILSLWPAGQIAGLVTTLDPEGQMVPLAEVLITAVSEPVIGEPPEPPTDPGLNQDQDDGTAPSFEFQALTDADGSYLIKGVPAGPYRVRAEKEGYDPQETFIVVEPGHTAVADFVLTPPLPTTGRIVGTVTGLTSTGEQQPLASALVIAVSSSAPVDILRPWAQSLGRADPAAALALIRSAPLSPAQAGLVWPPWPAGIVAATQTDQDGHYALTVPEGGYIVLAYADGYLVDVRWDVWVVAGQDSTVDFLLLPGPLTGTPLCLNLQTDKASYLPGEPVVITLTVQNTSDQTQVLHFPTSQQYDFAVHRGLDLLWLWSAGQVFLPVQSVLSLEAGQVLTLQETWNQTDQTGIQVPPDFYGVVGILPAQEGPLAAQNWILIEQEPPPPPPER